MKSDGQQAYEAAVRVMLEGDTEAGRVPDDGPDFAWDAIGRLERDSWEAAAAAVETGQVCSACEDRDQLRGKVLALATEWKDDAAADENRVSPERGSEIRARIRNQCADELRKIAGPPS